MKRNLFIFVLVFLMMPFFAAQQLKRLDRKYKVQYSRIHSRLTPSAKSQLARAVRQFENQMIPLKSGADHEGALKRIIAAAGLGSMDEDMACALVMFNVAKDAMEDLRMASDEVRKMNEAKKKQRELIKDVKEQLKKMGNDNKGKNLGNRGASPSEPAKLIKMLTPIKIFTPKCRVPFYKAPVVKPIPHLDRLSMAQLKRILTILTTKLKEWDAINKFMSHKVQLLMNHRTQLIKILANYHKKVVNNLKTADR